MGHRYGCSTTRAPHSSTAVTALLLSVEPEDAEPWIPMLADGGASQSGTYAVALPDRISIAMVYGGAGHRVSRGTGPARLGGACAHRRSRTGCAAGT